MTIRVLLADDHTLFREGIRAILSVHSEIEIVGEAGDGAEVLRSAPRLRPDVVLMDLKMPEVDGVAATRRLRAILPSCNVVALTTFDDDVLIFGALRAGAVGYLLKDAPSAQMVEAVRAAARGESLLQPSVASKVVAELARLSELAPPKADAPSLSPRELEVVRLLARGASNKEIAAALFIAEGTVKNHVTNILTKLDVTDRTVAALRARELGLL